MLPARAFDRSALAEAELVSLARSGDREAFSAIMQRCNQRLFRVARSVLGDEQEAEDVLQEAYVRAFGSIAGFRGEAAVATWLTRIVLNEAHGRLRRRRPTVDLAALEASHGAAVLAFPGVADPEAEAARAQARRLLERAVDQLPEAFRLVFMLREVEELSVEETAASLGLAPATVKTRLHRARRLLRLALSAELSDALSGAYPFLGERCARITASVLARLAQA